ncbi:hypothetical protein [uncultured Microscilla sp.]|uniref:hypothetical protein n=1 Tax=uncultured Microscilla sp. TaxID=432653 RepID=UPI00261CE456|nr:hypothetical protein [uncultured Microscilla sp.]
MDKKPTIQIVEQILTNIAQLLPQYLQNEANNAIAEGNVGVCLISEEGQTYGKMYGSDQIKQRFFYQLAWQKASQVWITKENTGVFEQKVFNGEINERKFGIKRHDFVGWEGGQIIWVNNQALAVGFSGLRAQDDLDIVRKAVKILKD